jgi:hypothetical protein
MRIKSLVLRAMSRLPLALLISLIFLPIFNIGKICVDSSSNSSDFAMCETLLSGASISQLFSGPLIDTDSPPFNPWLEVVLLAVLLAVGWLVVEYLIGWIWRRTQRRSRGNGSLHVVYGPIAAELETMPGRVTAGTLAMGVLVRFPLTLLFSPFVSSLPLMVHVCFDRSLRNENPAVCLAVDALISPVALIFGPMIHLNGSNLNPWPEAVLVGLLCAIAWVAIDRLVRWMWRRTRTALARDESEAPPLH